MFEHKLTKTHRLVYVFTGLIAIAFIVLFSVISFQLPKGFPPLARAAFGLGILFALGWAILVAYLPLYLYRRRIEDPRHEREAAGAVGAAPPGMQTP